MNLKPLIFDILTSGLLIIGCIAILIHGIKGYNILKPTISFGTVLTYLIILMLPLFIGIFFCFIINHSLIIAISRLVIYGIAFLIFFLMYTSIAYEISSSSFQYSGATVVIFMTMITGGIIGISELVFWGIDKLFFK